MTDTTLIWQAMSMIIPDSHPTIYQYIKGQTRSKESAVMRITEETSRIFYDVYDIARIRGVAREFLKEKESQYKKGNVKIKSIY